jgi:hypothetical protein
MCPGGETLPGALPGAVLCRGNGFMPLHHGLATSFTATGLRSGMVYKFRVRAENSVRARTRGRAGGAGAQAEAKDRDSPRLVLVARGALLGPGISSYFYVPFHWLSAGVK